jgi:hypothetical protein
MKISPAVNLVVVSMLVTLLAACETTKPEATTAIPPASAFGSPEQASSTAPVVTPAPVVTNSIKSVEPAPVAVEAPAKPKPEQLFAEGREAYDKGDYKSAIRKLTAASEGAVAASALQRDSYKLLAFSYCVTNQKAPCRVKFNSLLKIAPSFQLSRAEAGHPLWGPVFREAQAAVSQASKRN